MSEQDFVGSISTNEIWRDTYTNRCLTDDLDAMDAIHDALPSTYAPLSHTHSEYANTATVNQLIDNKTSPTVIANGTNLNSIMDVGVYCASSVQSDTYSLTNVPDCIGTSTFVLEVLQASGDSSRIQRITRTAKNEQVVAQRSYYGGSWGNWDTISVNGKRVLWSGVYHMTGNQVANLSDLVSNQERGITLVWSGYSVSGGEAANSNFHFHDVPKYFVRNLNGYGCVFPLASASFAKVGVKYLYINDDKIVGHASNNQSGTAASGITYDNAFYVLRYVLAN